MKTILIILFAALFVFGCTPKIPEKPYMIVSKSRFETLRQQRANPGKCRFRYQSADGQIMWFTDYENKYNIGDTIR